jgi:hypothetical protein
MHRTRYLVGLGTLGLAIAGVVFLLSLLRQGQSRPGLELRVEFRDARGLRAGADLRYRGVTVGTVRAVAVAADGGKAVATLLIDPSAQRQVRVDSTFWIVAPRFQGIAGGASGLDTLVRDSYVAFHSPDGDSSPLLPGSLLVGAERPPSTLEPESLEEIAHGDLLMSVLVPENHGLRPGSPVLFRGINTGDVRGIDLAKKGTHVEVRLRIARNHRQTVTDKSRFWVARPSLSGALFSGFTLTDVSAALVPYVSYYTEPGSGVPVEDGFRVRAEPSRPDLPIAEVPVDALAEQRSAPPPVSDPLVVVRIVYAAVEEDSLSSDDVIHREGSGLLYLDRGGRAVVLTVRSLVDGSYTEQDTFGGAPDIASEQLKVLVPGGPVLRAGRIWVDPAGGDMAVLALDGAPPDLRTTTGSSFAFDGEGGLAPTRIRSAAADGGMDPARPVEFPGNLPALGSTRGGILQHEDQVVGLYGQAGGHDETAVAVPLRLLPTDLRPVR